MSSYPSATPTPLFALVGNLPPEELIFGRSEGMAAIRKKVERVAGIDVPVLIQGDSGTGKEILAKLIHRRSPWHSGPFVHVNCPSIPVALLESELFGYEKGAFTGAEVSKPGWVEMASHGTLFLDEIAELDLPLQAKLLQVLQDGQFSRIGGQEQKVEVRIMCATNRSLEREIEAGTFRQDLFYRINVVNMHLAPLRERTADLLDLAEYFLTMYGDKYNARPRPLSRPMIRLLKEHDWPGNIRELENLMKTYVILDSEEAIRSELGSRNRTVKPEPLWDSPISLKKLTRDAVKELERKVILEVLEANNWNRKEAARSLNISYRTLFYKIRAAGVPGKSVLMPKRMPEPSGLTNLGGTEGEK